MLTFKELNLNPKGRKTCDCVIRAIAYATNQTWEETYKQLFEISLKSGYMLNEKRCEDKLLEQLGFEKHKQPRKADKTKYEVKELDKLIDTKKYITLIRVAHHLTVADNNQIIDTWDCGWKTIGNYYTKKK